MKAEVERRICECECMEESAEFPGRQKDMKEVERETPEVTCNAGIYLYGLKTVALT